MLINKSSLMKNCYLVIWDRLGTFATAEIWIIHHGWIPFCEQNTFPGQHRSLRATKSPSFIFKQGTHLLDHISSVHSFSSFRGSTERIFNGIFLQIFTRGILISSSYHRPDDKQLFIRDKLDGLDIFPKQSFNLTFNGRFQSVSNVQHSAVQFIDVLPGMSLR